MCVREKERKRDDLLGAEEVDFEKLQTRPQVHRDATGPNGFKAKRGHYEAAV